MATLRPLPDLLKLAKTGPYDDRFMAISDIREILERKQELDAGDLGSISKVVLERFQSEEQSEILSIAVKVLALVVSRDKPPVNDISNTLINLILSDKANSKDTYVLGMKSLITGIKESYKSDLINTLGGRDGLFLLITDSNLSIRIEGFHLYTTLFNRFCSSYSDGKKVVYEAISNLGAKGENNSALQTAAIETICSYLPYLANQYDVVVKTIIDNMKKCNADSENLRPYITCLGEISHINGYLLSPQISSFIDNLFEYVGEVKDSKKQNPTGDEIRAKCFMTLEQLTINCTESMKGNADKLINKAIQFAVYDPNFHYDENVTDDIGEANEDNGNNNNNNNKNKNEDDDDDDDEYDDDEYEYESDNGEEDDSWQIRTNAIKVLIACVNKEIISMDKLVETLGRLLIVRFQDRSENVKLEVIRCGSILLQRIISLSEHNVGLYSKDITSFLDMTISRILSYTQPQCSQNVRQSVYSYLSLFLLCLKYNPVKVKDSDINELMDRIIRGLSDSSSTNIVINSIECLNSCLLLFSDNNSILIKAYPIIIKSLLDHTQKPSFKVAIASSDTINSFLLYFSKQSTVPKCITDSLENICEAIKKQLLNESSLADYKCSLLHVVNTIYYYHNKHVEKLTKDFIDILLKCLSNIAITSSTLDVLNTILSNSSTDIVKPHITEILSHLFTILQKDEMNRVNSINLLIIIVNNFSSILPSAQVTILLDIVTKAISNKHDIYTTLQNIKLLTSLIEKGLVSDFSKLQPSVLNQILIISMNTTITNDNKEILSNYLTTLCKSNKVNGKELIKLIQKDVEKLSGNERNVIENYPQLLYGIILTLPDDITATIIKDFMECNVKIPTLYAIQLRCLGLLGRKINISKIYTNLYTKLESLLSEKMDIVTAAACFAYGNCCITSVDTTLSQLLNQISKNSGEDRYVVILQELIIGASHNISILQSKVNEILNILLSTLYSMNKIDGDISRQLTKINNIGMCLSLLYPLNPSEIFNNIDKLFDDEMITARLCSIYAIRYLANNEDVSNNIVSLLPKYIKLFDINQHLDLLRESLITFNKILSTGYNCFYRPLFDNHVFTDILTPLLTHKSSNTKTPTIDEAVLIRRQAYFCYRTAYLKYSHSLFDFDTLLPIIIGSFDQKYEVRSISLELLNKLFSDDEELSIKYINQVKDQYDKLFKDKETRPNDDSLDILVKIYLSLRNVIPPRENTSYINSVNHIEEKLNQDSRCKERMMVTPVTPH